MTIRIAVWSGPRNISTAMMRSWDSRADTSVMDEPFYGAYLRTTGASHPMRDEIMAAHSTDWDEIAEDCAGRTGTPVIYQKHMCQHMVVQAPTAWMAGLRHAFLIRSPEQVAASFAEKWDGLGPDDLGFRRQAELFDQVCQDRSTAPPVLESQDVLAAPEEMLRAMCAGLGVPFDNAMLGWRPGPRDTDGVWAAHWYNAVNQSTGFAKPRVPKAPPEALQGIVEICRPHYETMYRHRIQRSETVAQ
ncbi:MAG: HAD family hydrolase [Pseudomonadota bacterium]